MDRSTRTGVLAALGTEALYGGSFVFTKGVTATIDPFTLLAWRFATAWPSWACWSRCASSGSPSTAPW